MGSVSLQPKQFRQQTLWPTAAETTHVEGGAHPIEMGGPAGDRRVGQRGEIEFQSRRSLPNGGSQTMWQSQASLARFGDRLNRPSKTDPAREAELDSGQRAMFMSPREIHDRYQPLDGDRQDAGRDYGTDEVNWQPSTGTPERALWDDDMESDDQLWERKLDESQMPKSEYAEMHGGGEAATGTGTFVERLYERDSFPAQRTGHTGTWEQQEESYVNRKIDDWHEDRGESLYDSIRESGVKSPIRLGEDEGMMDKPMIVGGHHRLAAAANINENQFVPVLHHEDIREAQHDEKVTSAYPYS